MRFINPHEVKEGDVWNMATVKMYGGDKFSARKIFKDQQHGGICATILVDTNNTPIILDQDESTWERLEVIPMRSKFVDHVNPGDKDNYRFLKDRALFDEINESTPEMTGLLVEFAQFNKIDNTYAISPEGNLAATKLFREELDIFMKYRWDCLSFGEEVKSKYC